MLSQVTKATSLIGVLLTSSLALTRPAAQERLPATVSIAAREIRADRIRAHMAFLADDLLEGRETGTRGFDLAARYVATQFQESGLRPIAGSYRQEMNIRRARVDETRSSLTLVRGGTRRSLVYGEDFVTYGEATEPDIEVSGELLFVGNGVTAQRHQIDAYRGVNAVGKIVMAMPGAPAALTPSETSYFEDAEKKRRTPPPMAPQPCCSSPKSRSRGSFGSAPRANWGRVSGCRSIDPDA